MSDSFVRRQFITNYRRRKIVSRQTSTPKSTQAEGNEREEGYNSCGGEFFCFRGGKRKGKRKRTVESQRDEGKKVLKKVRKGGVGFIFGNEHLGELVLVDRYDTRDGPHRIVIFKLI